MGPFGRFRQRERALLHDPLRQARRDAAVYQRVGHIGLHYLRIARHKVRLQAVVHAQVRCQFWQQGQQYFLHDVGRGGQGRGRHDQTVHRAQLRGHGVGSDQAAQAVAQQNQGFALRQAELARHVDHAGQIAHQAAGIDHVATRPG